VHEVVKRAAELRIPGMYEARVFPDNGGLMSYGPNLPQMHEVAAEYVDKILRGAKPGDLPIQQPTRFELVVNRKVAKSQGFRLPDSLLLRADVVLD
jgi:putative ABC transport system substrate-binding protein